MTAPRSTAPRSVDAMREAVRGTGLLESAGARPLLVLASPGRDSACLVDLAVELRGAAGVQVLHVDHGLRDESAREAEGLAERVAAAGVQVHVERAGARPETGNVHAWARAERARLARAVAGRIQAGAVASAHTRTDLVETALFRLATQPGRRALLAMRAREPDAMGEGIPLVRPLLVLERGETLAWCRARGLRWQEDPSNADPRYARARLRHTVTPVLRGLNPRFEEAVVRTLGELEEERAVLDELVADALPAGADGIAVARLAGLPRPLGRLVVRELCERAIERPCARAASRLEELLERAASDPSPFALDVGDGARIEVRRGEVRAVRLEP